MVGVGVVVSGIRIRTPIWTPFIWFPRAREGARARARGRVRASTGRIRAIVCIQYRPNTPIFGVYTFAMGSTPPTTPNGVVILGSKKGWSVGVWNTTRNTTPDRGPIHDPRYIGPSRARARACARARPRTREHRPYQS